MSSPNEPGHIEGVDKHYNPEAGLKHTGVIGTLNKFRINPWFQVVTIAFVCFCCPGMYNALTGTGGGGQVDPTVNANASIALLSCTAATAILIAGPLLALVGPRNSLLLGCWTYALYSGSLLNFNYRANGAFVIASGAILGIGSSFLWVAQGAIMTSYVPESHKGRSIALFWFIFNIGGAIGSLISFGLNFDAKLTEGTVSNSTYIAFLVIMLVGWLLSVFICNPKHIANREMLQQLENDNKGLDDTKKFDMEKLWRSFKRLLKVVSNYRVFLMIPFFFAANVFYPYQQSIVNGYSFNVRTRSLSGAVYWIAQMFGGIVQGGILDMLPFDRRKRGFAGWFFLLCTTMAIWGGGYKYQQVLDARAHEEKDLMQTVDYKDGSIFLGPFFLYFFYGAFDSFWQSFAYWMMGAHTNSTYETGVMVGLYKGIQAAGGAMANDILAKSDNWDLENKVLVKDKYSWMTQFGMNWGLSLGSLLIIFPSVWAITKTNVVDSEGEDNNTDEEKAVGEPVGEQPPVKPSASAEEHQLQA